MLNNKSAVFIASLFVIFINYIIYTKVGTAPTVIIGGSSLLALIVWLKTTYKNPVNHQRILPLFLLAVTSQIIHTGEEYIADFPFHLSQLFELQNFDQHIFAIFVLVVAAAIWVLTAYGLIYKNQLSNYFLWFFLIGPGVVNGVAHVVFPVVSGQRYFPGLITVVLPTALSLIIIKRIVTPKSN